MMDFNQNETSTDPKQVIVDLITQELNGIRRRMTELKDQISTVQNTVDREQSRYSGISIELRNIKENLDTVPREDIRDRYEEALEARFKSATMRGQLEKFEAIYEQLEQRQQILTQILSSFQGFGALPMMDDDSPANQGTLDIVGIIGAQEDERERLSRALHDGPAQSLTNFILQAEICQRLFDRNPEKAAEELNNLKTNASKTFQKVREFIFDLKPMMLDDLGLGPTVRRYVESYGGKNDIEAKADIISEDRRLEKYRETMLFRSIQDLMNMARDYGAPSSILVKMDLSGKVVRVSVEDNGNAFDVASALDPEAEPTEARTKGLKMLQSKFQLVKGKVEARSTDQDGTIIRLEIPAE